MTILNFGSINLDRSFRVRELPLPGETIAARSERLGLGGKGANQSAAIARSGGNVRHLGAIGAADGWLRTRLEAAGVDARHVHERPDASSGQALVFVADSGENSIVLLVGANATISRDEIFRAVGGMAPGDWLLMQNETNDLAVAAELARAAGLRIAFAAAPFSPDAVMPLLGLVDLLALNTIEFAQLTAAGADLTTMSRRPALLVTSGASGARYLDGETALHVPAVPVTPVDTTAAGDTFLGAFLACLDRGETVADALRYASAAAALQVTRAGAAEAIPERAEVEALLDTLPDLAARRLDPSDARRMPETAPGR
jgi:ribokinase